MSTSLSKKQEQYEMYEYTKGLVKVTSCVEKLVMIQIVLSNAGYMKCS